MNIRPKRNIPVAVIAALCLATAASASVLYYEYDTPQTISPIYSGGDYPFSGKGCSVYNSSPYSNKGVSVNFTAYGTGTYLSASNIVVKVYDSSGFVVDRRVYGVSSSPTNYQYGFTIPPGGNYRSVGVYGTSQQPSGGGTSLTCTNFQVVTSF